MALRRRESQGMPDVPLVWVVHPMMNLLPDQIEALAERIMPDVIDSVAGRVQARQEAAK